MRRSLPAILGGLLLLASIGAEADRLRCGRHFIKNGDTKYEVLKACGEPQWKEQISGFDGAVVEVWVYESEWSRFPRQLTFNGARVERIDRLDAH